MIFRCIKYPLICFLLLSCQPKSPLESILANGSNSFSEALTNHDLEIQVVYGQIIGDSIIHHSYCNNDTSNYFYPASTVKMPVAFAALKKLSELDLPTGTEIRIDSTAFHPRTLTYDSLFDGPITIENLVKKIFVFSDNQAYNILYGWLGKDYINGLHNSLGLQTRIVHQLSESAYSFSPESNNITNQVELLDIAGAGDWESSAVQTWESSLAPKSQQKGEGYLDSLGTLVEAPFDFSKKNYVPLVDLLGCLERVVKPEAFTKSQRYGLDEKMRQELMDIMRLRPGDLPSPVDTLPDNHVKFLLFGDQKDTSYPKHIEIRNKVGWAYGYLLDVAHIRDTERDIEFFLAARIHVNSNNIYNDGVYEYEEVGLPILGELGRLVYEYELDLRP